MKILVVDDEPSNLQVAGSALRQADRYRISLAMNGEDALKQAKNSPPDLILLDVMMPGLSGYEVCRMLKEDLELKQIPVIFLTAKAEISDYVEGFRAGGADYISKPFVPEILLARIETHLNLFMQQKELQYFHQCQEEHRREERHAAYQNGLTEMGITLLHTIGNAITGVDSHVHDLAETRIGLQKIGEAFEKVNELYEQPDEREKTQKLIHASSQLLNETYLQRFEENVGGLDAGVRYIKEVLNAQRNLTRPELVSTHFVLSTLLSDVKLLVKSEFNSRKIDFVVHEDGNIAEVHLPRSPLGQMLIQLIKNSLEAIERHTMRGPLKEGEGRVKLEVKRDESAGFWLLQLSDNGDGIAAELLPEVMKARVTTKEEGAGLGLHNAANFVLSTGGTLQVKSSGRGQGTLVEARFPLDQALA